MDIIHRTVQIAVEPLLHCQWIQPPTRTRWRTAAFIANGVQPIALVPAGRFRGDTDLGQRITIYQPPQQFAQTRMIAMRVIIRTTAIQHGAGMILHHDIHTAFADIAADRNHLRHDGSFRGGGTRRNKPPDLLPTRERVATWRMRAQTAKDAETDMVPRCKRHDLRDGVEPQGTTRALRRRKRPTATPTRGLRLRGLSQTTTLHRGFTHLLRSFPPRPNHPNSPLEIGGAPSKTPPVTRGYSSVGRAVRSQ